MIKRKIVFTSGCFDLFHFGHLNILLKAKKLGDYLIVGVSTDKLIKQYKGLKPIIPFRERCAILKQIKCVDSVVAQTKLVDLEQFKSMRADVFVLGDDWKDRTDNDGINWLRNNNKIVFVPYTKHLSTSKIKEKIIRNAYQIIQAQTKKR